VGGSNPESLAQEALSKPRDIAGEKLLFEIEVEKVEVLCIMQVAWKQVSKSSSRVSENSKPGTVLSVAPLRVT
jgi:hypothetical protein